MGESTGGLQNGEEGRGKGGGPYTYKAITWRKQVKKPELEPGIPPWDTGIPSVTLNAMANAIHSQWHLKCDGECHPIFFEALL